MKKSRNLVARLALGMATSLVVLASQATAQTVTFAGLPGSNGSAFTGPYVEQGLTFTTIAGQVFEGHVFGNPTPSLVVGSVFGGGNSGTIEVTGANFVLSSFDLSAQNGNAGYTVDGFLGAANVYSFGGSAGSGFSTYGGNAGLVDRLVFTLNPTGTSVNFDNLTFQRGAAVPEPATWAMLILGFGMVGGAMRAGKVRRTTAISFA